MTAKLNLGVLWSDLLIERRNLYVATVAVAAVAAVALRADLLISEFMAAVNDTTTAMVLWVV